jgi:hypothetical protein
MRDINKARYVVASVMTLCIFLLGLMLGLIIEDKRISKSQEEDEIQRLDYRSMQLQYEYINQLSLENDCAAMLETFEQNLNNLESSRMRLENYLRDSKISKDEFNRVKRDYTISQIQYWLFAKKQEQLCDSDDVSVLYFFADDKSCPDCNDQSFVLTYLKKLFGSKLLIFSLNSNFTQEPMIGMLERSYNVTEYPTMFIGNDKLEGLHDKDKLIDIICPRYSDEAYGCEAYQDGDEVADEGSDDI